MRHTAILSLVLFLFPALASAQEKDAKPAAQDLLNKGSVLFDKYDAAVMAETYTDDAKVVWIEKSQETGKYKIEVKDGRAEIEKFYREMFKNSKEKETSRNTVEFAKYVAPDLMLIEGVFEPNVGRGKYAFVQERVKQGDRWLIQCLRIYIVPSE